MRRRFVFSDNWQFRYTVENRMVCVCYVEETPIEVHLEQVLKAEDIEPEKELDF